MLRYAAILAFLLCLTCPVSFPQEQAVVPITKLSIYGPVAQAKFGSGFCLDPECRFVVTNYHVAKMMGKHFTIEHEKVVERWMDDEYEDGKVPLHDLAVVELWHGLGRKGFHGLEYNLTDPEDLVVGQEVDIYSYPLEFNPKRKLLHFHGKYIGINKLDNCLAFSYEPDPQRVKGGASGGLILDSKGKVIAVLSGIAIKTDQTIVVGVPVKVLAGFVSKNQPYLAAQLFPESVFIPPVEADHYPEWIPPAPEPGVLQHRVPEPADVVALRDKATGMVNNSYTLISVQSYEWGKGSAITDPQAIAYYEVRMIDGYQHFREYPDGTKEMDDIHWPPMNHSVMPGDAWDRAPKMVANDYKLKIHRADDIVEKGQTLRVFQYIGKKEDNVCVFDDAEDLGFYVHHHIEAYDCFGEVWTDQDNNFVRISENYKMHDNVYRQIVTFEWVDIDGVRSEVPATIHSSVREGEKDLWCRGLFTNYQQFRTKARLVPYEPKKLP
jgi:hypothetical protein